MENNSTQAAPEPNKDTELFNEIIKQQQEILGINTFDATLLNKIRDIKSLIIEYKSRLTKQKEELDILTGSN